MIIGLLITAAVTLLLIALPLGGTAAGGVLKRWAGFVFLLALIPSMCIDMTRMALRNHPSWTPGSVALEVLTVLIVSAVAYVVLAMRRVMGRGDEPKRRVSTKQPMTPPGARSDLFSMLRDELRGGDDGD